MNKQNLEGYLYISAPIKWRLLAILIDYFILFVISLIFWWVFCLVLTDKIISGYIASFIFFVINTLYFLFFDYFFNQTIGKKVCKIFIIQEESLKNKKIKFIQILKIDFLFSFYFSATLAVSLISCLYLSELKEEMFKTLSTSWWIFMIFTIFISLFSFSIILWILVCVSRAFNQKRMGFHEVFAQLRVVRISGIQSITKDITNKNQQTFPDFTFYENAIKKEQETLK